MRFLIDNAINARRQMDAQAQPGHQQEEQQAYSQPVSQQAPQHYPVQQAQPFPATSQPATHPPAREEVHPIENDWEPIEQKQKACNDDLDFVDVKDAKIVVIGVGGMGNNAINRLYNIGIQGAETIAINTDKQHLLNINAHRRILIGKDVTRGLGAGGYPVKGRQAALESQREIKDVVEQADMVFLVAGMGGGTGTGAAPVVAELARRSDAIVIGVVTMPFRIEGSRIGKAEEGLARLRQVCDTVIVIENDRLLEIAGEMPLQQAFAVADEIIVTMIKGITETIALPSTVNLDFADVKAVMSGGGVAVIGVGESSSAARAREAVEEAMTNPLLDVSYEGATGALIHISGGPDMKLSEIGEIGDFVAKHLDPDAQTIWGARVDPSLQGTIRVITIITGVQSPYIVGPPRRENLERDLEPKNRFNQELGIEQLIY